MEMIRSNTRLYLSLSLSISLYLCPHPPPLPLGIRYEAQDVRDGSRCAIKISDLAELAELENEIAMQQLCNHPNVVTVHQSYAHEDKLWIVLELLDGGSLTDCLGVRVEWPESHIAYVFFRGGVVEEE